MATPYADVHVCSTMTNDKSTGSNFGFLVPSSSRPPRHLNAPNAQVTTVELGHPYTMNELCKASVLVQSAYIAFLLSHFVSNHYDVLCIKWKYSSYMFIIILYLHNALYLHFHIIFCIILCRCKISYGTIFQEQTYHDFENFVQNYQVNIYYLWICLLFV